MGQKCSCKNKKKDLKVSVSIESTKAWKIRKSVILDQAGVKKSFYDKNGIFELLNENIINWNLYKFTYIKTHKNYEILEVL